MVVFVVLAFVVVAVVVEVGLGVEIVLPDGVQRHVVQACRMVAQSVEDVCADRHLVVRSDLYFGCQVH